MKIRLTILLTFVCFVCSARQYKIVSMHDVELFNSVTKQPLKTNVVYDTDSGGIIAKWQGENGYYDFYDTSTGETRVVRKSKVAVNEEGWFDRLLSLIFGVKKCSSRAADNELFGGLDKYLSQTFYLSLGNELHSEIFVASNLKQDEKCYFKLQVVNLKNCGEIRLAPSRGFRITAESFKELVAADQVSKLRCKVIYVTPDDQDVVITDSMNIVFLP